MKYRIAVGTRNNIDITEHFGQCGQFLILDIDQESDEITTVGLRETVYSSQCGEHQEDKIKVKLSDIRDCHIVLVKQIGGQSEKLLNHNGIIALQYEGSIDGALIQIKKFYKKYIFRGKE